MRKLFAIVCLLPVLAGTPLVQAEGLSGPESVRYDPELDLYFVSNFNGSPSGDANGFVSKMSPDGELLVAKFMVGSDEHPFHGGRGMYIDKAGLWVVDAGGVHLFDRTSGKQLDFIDFTQFKLGFLNDIVKGKDGALYVTDTGEARLYRIDERDVSFVTTVPVSPNGITVDPAISCSRPGVTPENYSLGALTSSASRQSERW